MKTPSIKMVAAFFVITFMITWAVLIPAFRWIPDQYQTPFIILAAFGPFLSGLIVMGKARGGSAVREWLRAMFVVRGRWMVIIFGFFVMPVLMGGLHFGLYRFLGGQSDSSSMRPWWSFPIAMILTALLTGGNEEPGWRGFAAPAISRWMHPIIAAVILGMIHSAWHLPIMHKYDTTFWMYTFNIVGLTFILNWFYFRSSGCVIPVMLLHAGTNVIGDYIPSPDTVLNGLGSYMLLRGIVYWVMAIVIIIATKGRLGYQAEPTDN